MKRIVLSFSIGLALLVLAPRVFGQATTICADLSKYAKMVPTNFKAVQGPKNEKESEAAEEEIFDATATLADFDHARIVPTFSAGKKKLQFYKLFLNSKEADAFMATIKTQLDACLNVKTGYRTWTDSGLHFYESATAIFEFMQSNDFDENDNEVYKVLVQVMIP